MNVYKSIIIICILFYFLLYLLIIQPLAAGEYDPNFLKPRDNSKPIMSDDTMFANQNYNRAMEKLNKHITTIDNLGETTRTKTVTFREDAY